MITTYQLQACMPKAAPAKIAAYRQAISDQTEKFQINTPKRLAAFISQIAVESGNLQYVVENLNYSAQGLVATFPKYFDTFTAQTYARNPGAIANRVYANRMGNGDEASGDGWKYRGRGLIQLTGKNNYQACSAGLALNLLETPEYLESPDGATASACWFWTTRGLNTLADAGDVTGISKKVNGGTHGLTERLAVYSLSCAVLGA